MPQHQNTITTIFKDTQLIIFDLDGTLYDQRKLRAKLYFNFLVNLLLLKIRPKDLRIVSEFRRQRENHKGYHSASLHEDQYTWCIKRTRVPAERIRKTIDKLMIRMPLKLLKGARYPYVISFINALRNSGFKIAVYSDYPVDEKLSVLEIVADKTFCSTEEKIAQLKPSKDGLILICKTFRLNINQALYIGDREDTDGESARMAGMPFLKVNTKLARKGTFYSNLIKLLKNGKEE